MCYTYVKAVGQPVLVLMEHEEKEGKRSADNYPRNMLK